MKVFLTQTFLRRCIFILAIFLFLFFNASSLYQGHNWGGDFSQYIMHARNVAEGQPYASNIALELWVISPPGYPFLLAPFIYIFGLNFRILKLTNLFFWLLYALVLGKIAYRRLGADLALGVVLVILSSPYFFWFKQNILSDISFLFFITAGLLSANKYFEQERSLKLQRRWLCLALCFMFCAQITRLAGASLFIAIIIYVLIAKKAEKSLIVILGTWILAAAVLWLFGATPWQHFKEIHLGFIQWIKISYLRCADILKYMIAFYLSPVVKTPLSAPLFPFLEKACDILNPFFLIGMVIFLFRRIKKGSVSLLGVFVSVYFLAWAGWSLSGGERYGLPVFGLGFILILEYILKAGYKFSSAIKKILIIFLLILISHNVFSIYQNYDFNDDYCFKKETKQLIAWVNNQTPEDARFMFYKPRILSLFTRRQVTTNWNFWQSPQEDQVAWLKRVKRLKIDYLIKAKLLNDYWFLNPHDIFSNLLMNPVWQNDEYIIFRILQ